MDRQTEKRFNVVFDECYNLKNHNRRLNNKIESYLNLLMDALEEYAKENNREFKLNQRSQKFRLYKIK
jgi:hypothetical protein